MFVYSKSYINFEEIIKTKDMKNELKAIEFTGKNFKIVDLESYGKQVYFTIKCGERDQMYMAGDLSFNVSDDEIESVDIYLEHFDWENKTTTGFLNSRNTKLICEKIESIVIQDPESYGFDWYEYEEDQRNWNQNLQFDILKESKR